MDKMNLYKFTHTIVKKWCPIETKKWQSNQKKYDHPNLLLKKSCIEKKKSRLNKKKKEWDTGQKKHLTTY